MSTQQKLYTIYLAMRWYIPIIVYSVIILGLSLIWYAGQFRNTFVWFDDLDEWMGMDKLGHIYATTSLARILYTWYIPYYSTSSIRYVGVISILSVLSTSVFEVLDGFGVGYGASIYDIFANLIGGGIFFVQMAILKDIKIPIIFGYWSTSEPLLNPSLLGNNWASQLLKNYNGQTYWFRMPKISIPYKKKSIPLLSVCIGYSIDGCVHATDEGISKLLISFDLPVNCWFENKYGSSLVQYFKTPMPTLEFSIQRGVKWHWVYL